MDVLTAHPAQIDARLAELWDQRWPLEERHREGQLSEHGQRRLEELAAQMHPLEEEYLSRGRWSRYYRVDRTGGHIHRHMLCSTCGPRTRFRWLIELAAKSEQEMIAELGADAWLLCTVCFPDAPVLDKPRDESKCDGQPASGQGTRLNKKCAKCAHVGSARRWKRHQAK